MSAIPAYRQVVNKIKRHAERHNWIPALDGGRLYVRSPHSALNTSLQSAGALIAKRWGVEMNNILQYEYEAVHGWDGDYVMMAMIHDEYQFAINVPEVLDVEYVDDFDYSSMTDDKKIKELQANRKKEWFYNTFQRVRVLADITKEAVKRVENHFNYKCPLDCEWIAGFNWADCH